MSHVNPSRWLLLLSMVVTTIQAGADVIFVPADHQTINAAIEAASNGDIIQVDPGVYVENLVLNNKRIAIRGGYPFGDTVIDGSSAKGSFRSCVLVSGTSKLVLDRVVLRNGGGSSIFGITRGGGIYAEYAVLELIDVTDHAAGTSPYYPADSRPTAQPGPLDPDTKDPRAVSATKSTAQPVITLTRGGRSFS